jgi:hypothetical protein
MERLTITLVLTIGILSAYEALNLMQRIASL